MAQARRRRQSGQAKPAARCRRPAAAPGCRPPRSPRRCPPQARCRWRRRAGTALSSRSASRGAALAAEPRPIQRAATIPAEFLRGLRSREGVPAFLAELPCAAFLAARRAHPGGLVVVVNVLCPVLRLDLGIQLIELRLCLHLGHRLVELRRAGRAKAALSVPADLIADPLAAVVALLEVRLHLLDGLGERLIAGRAAHGVAQELGVPAELRCPLADRAADHVTTKAEQPPAESGHRMLERRRIAVTAATAVKLELVPVVGAA